MRTQSEMSVAERGSLCDRDRCRSSGSVSVWTHCLLVWCLLFSGVAAVDEPLTVSVFISGITEETSGFTGELDGRPFQAATELAKDLINRNPDLLPGYELQLDYTDAKVSPVAVEAQSCCYYYHTKFKFGF